MVFARAFDKIFCVEESVQVNASVLICSLMVNVSHKA